MTGNNADLSGDLVFKVVPERLREASSMFHKASQDTFDQISNLYSTTFTLLNEMATDLTYTPDATQRFWSRWQEAMTRLGNSLEKVATTLENAAESYESTDNNNFQIQPLN